MKSRELLEVAAVREFMQPRLQDYTADQRYLVEAAGRAAGLVDLVAFDAGFYSYYLLRKAIIGPLLPHSIEFRVKN